ncbi:hypothetical protein JRO89_XS13G0052600 [Xanthoceras sorbifolium]|uniref:transaldolase n=1 Tax=Xanthoceras sorbifolium TaxID=99658 RepID=A0ABQ8H6Q4_9ROSI|nr:hypothetical protein JRO89_XS13G0052600 [Xanthoceras sorbifolium]
MSITLQSPPSSALSSTSSSSLHGRNLRLLSTVHFNFRRSFPLIRSSSSSIDAGQFSSFFLLRSSLCGLFLFDVDCFLFFFEGLSTELDSVSSFSQIVPDTVIFDDFERFPPTAATVSSSLLLGICSLPDTIFRNAVDMALADSGCCKLENSALRLSCFFNKALVNVGGDLAKLVPGRVSTEVDARLAYDTHGIIKKVKVTFCLTFYAIAFICNLMKVVYQNMQVHDLLKLYNEIDVPPERLLFKIPSTWQGIEASRLLESEGIQTHLTFVYRYDWARNHSGDPEIEAALKRGEDPGLTLATKTYNYIHKYGHKSKLMAAAVRNKQDLFSLLGIDYIIAPLKVLQSLKESVTAPDEKYSFVRRLSPESASMYNFSEEELTKWDQLSLASAMGPASVELLGAGLEGYVNQAKRVEELFAKIWPPPNV